MDVDQMLQDFANKPLGGAFPNIARMDVVDGLRARIAPGGASCISQRRSSLCGAAAVMFCLVNRDPMAYVRYVIDLYEKGSAQFGTLTVKPGDACRNYAPKQIDEVDWIALASLRDSENRFMSYASVESDAAAITMPETIVSWFKALGATTHKSAQWFGGLVQNQYEIASAGTACRSGRDVCLFINAQMLEGSMDALSVNPNHWIVLTKAISLDTKKREIALEIFTWGGIRRVPDSGTANLDDFLKNYYGYVWAR